MITSKEQFANSLSLNALDERFVDLTTAYVSEF